MILIFTDYVSDEELPYHYSVCDVYATASLWGDFNLPAVEAQACGKSVAAFDIGSHCEVIKTPENGLLISAGDTKALSNAILELLNRKYSMSLPKANFILQQKEYQNRFHIRN
jgi:glycosyltransferase involved in cell wall biosynthesis